MPGGRTHATATVVLLVLSTIGTGCALWYGHMNLFQMLALLAGIVASFMVNPDLDLNRRFPRTKPSLWLWWIYWYPYSRMVGHRSKFSHWIGLGTIIRAAYLLWSIMLLMWYNGAPIELWMYLSLFTIGIGLSDTLHIMMDSFSW